MIKFAVLIEFTDRKVEHRIKAADAGSAEDRALRAYPKKPVVEVRVWRVAA